jgi:hypothetical protein
MQTPAIRVFVAHMVSETNHTLLEALTILATRGKEVHSELAFLDIGRKSFCTATALISQGTVLSDVSEDSFYGIIRTDLEDNSTPGPTWEWQEVTGLLTSDASRRSMQEWCTSANANYDLSAYWGIAGGCLRDSVHVREDLTLAPLLNLTRD